MLRLPPQAAAARGRYPSRSFASSTRRKKNLIDRRGSPRKPATRNTHKLPAALRSFVPSHPHGPHPASPPLHPSVSPCSMIRYGMDIHQIMESPRPPLAPAGGDGGLSRHWLLPVCCKPSCVVCSPIARCPAVYHSTTKYLALARPPCSFRWRNETRQAAEPVLPLRRRG